MRKVSKYARNAEHHGTDKNMFGEHLRIHGNNPVELKRKNKSYNAIKSKVK